jgi:protein O-mannosyl-transferase
MTPAADRDSPKPGKDTRTRRAAPVPRSRARLGIPFLLAAFACLLYAGTLSYTYVLDDDVITRGHTYVQQGLRGLSHIFSTNYLYGFDRSVDLAYRPLPLASTALEVDLYGNQPSRHHLGNVLLYGLLAVGTWWTLRLLVGRQHPTLPWMATALFLAHPVHTEVVANIKGREELLAALFGIVSLGCLFRALDKDRQSISPRGLALALLLYLGALFSKETAYAFFPIALLALAAFADLGNRRLAAIAGLYGAVTALSVLVRVAVSHHPGIPVGAPTVINNALVGASGWGERLATISEIFARYAGLLVFPWHLSFDYSYNAVPIVNWGRPIALLGLLLVLGSVAGIVIAWRRGPSLRATAFFLATLWVALLPGSNLFFLTGTTMAERFLFVPSLGLAGLIALGLEQVSGRLLPPPRGRRVAVGALGILLLAGSLKTFDRARDWSSNTRLFQAALRTTPASARVHHHVGSSLREQGEAERNPERRTALLRQALAAYQDALSIQPRFAEAEYNAGVTYYDLGDTTEAEAAYLRTLDIDPDHADALNNLGVIAFQRKYPAGAEAYFARAVRHNPWNLRAVMNLGAAIIAEGDLERARAVYVEALQRSPDDPALLQCLLEVATRMKDPARAQIYRDRLQELGR